MRTHDAEVIHAAECEHHFCPCFQAGLEMRAYNHWSMLVWLARKDPGLLRAALAEAGEVRNI